MKTKIFIAILFVLGGPAAKAAIYKLSAEKGQVTFLAKGKPALISIKGEGEGAYAAITEKNQIFSGAFSFQLKSLKTGIELRDDHLKNKYLEVDKYPSATLKISDLKLPENLKDAFVFKGTLNLHGVDQPVEGMARLTDDTKSQKISADFKIKLSQFKIEIPSFKGITVAEEVQVKVEAPVVREE